MGKKNTDSERQLVIKISFNFSEILSFVLQDTWFYCTIQSMPFLNSAIKCVIKFFSGLSILISELILISWFKHLNILKFDLDIKLLSMLINVPVNSNSSFSAIPLCEQHCLQIRAYLLFGPSPTRYSITCKNITPMSMPWPLTGSKCIKFNCLKCISRDLKLLWIA